MPISITVTPASGGASSAGFEGGDGAGVAGAGGRDDERKVAPCWSSVAADRSTTAGVALMWTIGPGCTTAPRSVSATVTTDRSCSICGCARSSLPWRKISAHTSGSRSNTSCHSAVVLARTAASMRSKYSVRCWMSSKSGTDDQWGSSNIQSSSSARMNAENSRGVVCENCIQRPSADSATSKRKNSGLLGTEAFSSASAAWVNASGYWRAMWRMIAFQVSWAAKPWTSVVSMRCPRPLCSRS